MTPNSLESPTLHVNPGDTLNITVTNNTPTNPVGVTTTEQFHPPNCGDTTFSKTIQTNNPPNLSMTGGSMNIHYHGTNTSPACH
jgi:FtsP/CotA-like multicopper oxidase with cupredoxin domain